MKARDGEHGYGWVTRTLHWSTVGLVIAQFVVGYLMHDEGGRGRGRGRGEGSGHGRGRGGEDEVISLLPVHVTIGITILLVANLRVFWRVSTPLPPWAESLSHSERRIASLTVLGEDDDLLGVHVAAPGQHEQCTRPRGPLRERPQWCQSGPLCRNVPSTVAEDARLRRGSQPPGDCRARRCWGAATSRVN